MKHTRPYNGPLSGTTRVSPCQKGRTNLDFTKARDSEWQWHQLGHMQVCTLLQTDNHASTPPLSFLQARCPSCRPTNSVKALKVVKLKPNTQRLVVPGETNDANMCTCWPVLEWVHERREGVASVCEPREAVRVKQDFVITQCSTEHQQRVTHTCPTEQQALTPFYMWLSCGLTSH